MISNRWCISADELPSQRDPERQCLQQSLPEEAGAGGSSVFQLDEGLSYIHTRYEPAKDLAILSHIESPEPRMVLTLGLQGQSCFACKQGDELIFNEGFASISVFNSSVGVRQYEAHKPITQVRLAMSKPWLEKYFGEQKFTALFNKKNVQQVCHQPISHPGIVAARQLLAHSAPSDVSRLFIHAQVMSILAAELGRLGDSPATASTDKFTLKDRDMAMQAKEILAAEFKNPPSVDMLAKRVGTNQCKLKKLFHHFFNDTPYGVLLEIRMNNAYVLLETTHCQVAAAADFVGYGHASNFSLAFMKHFGIAPKIVAKN